MCAALISLARAILEDSSHLCLCLDTPSPTLKAHTADQSISHTQAHEYAHISKDHTIHESLQHTYLLDIVLALASIHLASSMQDATVAHRHIKTALQYQNRSVLGLRVALSQISERNLSAVLLASVLNLICALTSPLFPTSYDNSPTPSTVDVMQSGIAHFGGIGFVMNTYRDSINKGPLAAIFCEPSPLSPSDDMASCLEDIRLLHKRLCAKMLSQNDDLLLSLVAASQNLEIVCLKSNGRSMFSWIATVDMDFFHAVNRQHDAAVALFMAWGVLMYRLDESWWAKHVGKTIVQELSAKTRSWCGQEDLIEVVQWCREQVGIENCSANEIAVC